VVEIKTPGEIQAMRASGRVVAQILATVRAQAAAGMRLSELDEAARAVLAAAGATSPFLGYRPSFAPVPYPAAICASVNDAALHGIPDRYRLVDGDLLSVDCGAVLDGWAADAAISFTIGPPRPADARLIATTEAALRAGIAAAAPGARIGDISIEPWFLAGGQDSYYIDDDGWTIRSGDGSRAAHAEHTVAITADGPQVLTTP